MRRAHSSSEWSRRWSQCSPLPLILIATAAPTANPGQYLAVCGGGGYGRDAMGDHSPAPVPRLVDSDSAGLPAIDGPALLLAAATAALPDDRRGWGAAMAAELDQVRGGSSRWWFAAGCARTAIFPPSNSRTPVRVAGAGGGRRGSRAGGRPRTVLTSGLCCGLRRSSAEWRRSVARSRRTPGAARSLIIGVVGLAGVATCIALTALPCGAARGG